MSDAAAKVVEIMARAMAIADRKDPDAPAFVSSARPKEPWGLCWRDQYADKAECALAALGAAGAEVVLWRPFQPSDIPLPLDVETHCFPFGTVRYKDMTHWTILKGPQ